MNTITTSCTKCQKQFLILSQEQRFVAEKDLPLPTWCPTCRQERRLSLRGGRQLFKTTCQKCGNDTIVAFDPSKTRNMILCKKDYDDYFLENDSIIHEPLPTI